MVYHLWIFSKLVNLRIFFFSLFWNSRQSLSSKKSLTEIKYTKPVKRMLFKLGLEVRSPEPIQLAPKLTRETQRLGDTSQRIPKTLRCTAGNYRPSLFEL